MTDQINQQFPEKYIDFYEATKISGFTMASKPSGKFLEPGTGILLPLTENIFKNHFFITSKHS